MNDGCVQLDDQVPFRCQYLSNNLWFVQTILLACYERRVSVSWQLRRTEVVHSTYASQLHIIAILTEAAGGHG